MSEFARLYPTGRKHCSGCKCWRHLIDFQRNKAHLQARCKTCQRVYLRNKKGHKPLRPGYCRRGHHLTPENSGPNSAGNKFCRICARARRRRVNRTEKMREYQRIYKEAKRREAGILPRKPAREAPKDAPLRLPAEPFAGWLREYAPEGGGDLRSWSLGHGIDDSTVRKIRKGQQLTVHVDIVDRVVGPADLNELYPVE